MTPKSFFIVVVKIIGVFFLVDILEIVLKYLNTFLFLFKSGQSTSIIGVITVGGAILFLYALLVRYILFKSDKIVEKLNLDKQFTEETFAFNMHRSSVLQIGILVTGGITLIQNFVPMLINVFVFFQNKNDILDTGFFIAGNSFSGIDFVRDILMTLIGYYLVTNSNYLTHVIEAKRRRKRENNSLEP
jgi:hypothetical protein